jgi:hypothetical protein
MFDFIGKPWFLGIIALAIVDGVWVYGTGHSINLASLRPTIVTSLVWLVMMAICARYQSAYGQSAGAPATDRAVLLMAKLGKVAEVLLFLSAGWVALRLYNHLSMTLPVPYADPLLHSWDKSLFGMWNDYFRFVAERPWLIAVLGFSYTGLTALSVIGCMFLLFTGREQATRFFIYTFTVTAVFATTWGALFPAQAAVATVLDSPELLAAFAEKPGWYSIEIIEELRTAEGIVFDFGYLPGLTTFPSFHTAAGVILAYSFRGSRLFAPVCVYSLIMIASTPVIGGHYFVDLCAGSFLALVVCRWFETMPGFEDVFSPTGVAGDDRRMLPAAAASS